MTKHFAGYGQVLGGSNFAAIEISPRTLSDEICPSFSSGGAAAQHLGHYGFAWRHQWSGQSCKSLAAYRGCCVTSGDFQGYVVSDSNDIARLHSFMKVAETPEDAVEMAVRAGMDVDLYSDLAYALLPEMAKQDAGLEKYIDRSVRQVLRTKFILGLFDQPYIDVDEVRQGVRATSSLELAKQMDEESITLLKNEGNLLPLNKMNVSKVALLGPLLGEGTKAAFEAVAGESVRFSAERGFKLTNERGGNPKLSSNNEQAIDKMVSMASDADLVVLFLGGDEFTAKEAFFNNAIGDRDSIDPVGQQDELLQKVKALGKPVVVVLKHRRTLSINVIAEQADAILDCWDLSEFGDEVLATNRVRRNLSVGQTAGHGAAFHRANSVPLQPEGNQL